MNKRIKRVLSYFFIGVLAFTMLFSTGFMSNVEASSLPHTKATASDVVVKSAENMKGIQGTEWMDGTYSSKIPDPDSLNVKHVVLNINISDVISTNGTGEAFTYNGQTYYFNYENCLKIYDLRIQELRQKGIAITVVLLMPWTNDNTKLNLIVPSGRVNDGTHWYYALNVYDTNATNMLNATFSYMAEKFSYSDNFVQNWIIGNEVNVPGEYNYSGSLDFNTNVDMCVRSFDMLYNALQTYNPNAKAYISLTHNWQNNNNGNGFATKEFIDAFAARENDKNWNIAFHAYPPNLKVSMRTREAASWLRDDDASMYVCGLNLDVMTNYLKEKYGTSHRIIMSEQSYCSQNIGYQEQAAMLAYTYYAGVRNDLVDAVMFSSFADSSSAVHEGYKLGIVTEDGIPKMYTYDAFATMNTNNSYYTDQLRDYLGISNWSDSVLYKSPATGNYITGASLYKASSNDRTGNYFWGLSTSTSAPMDLEYRWVGYDSSTESWFIISDWRLNYEFMNWTAPHGGNFIIQAQVRAPGNAASHVEITDTVSPHPHLRGKCQMPYWGPGGGYLIGVESYDNPNQSYYYRMIVYDFSLNTWVTDSGLCKVSEGNACWILWQPQWGYYMTLFNIYDGYGNLIDQDCYAFVNAY